VSVPYLLDTHVISEVRKSQPNHNVLSFLQTAGSPNLFLSVLTIGQLRKGAALKARTDLLAAGILGAWIDGLELSFGDRMPPIDAKSAKIWGEWCAVRSISVIDTLLAATAVAHGMTLVTRKIRDLEDTGVRILNPWNGNFRS
jgi:predicted nucleic acid-binding protein